MNAASTSSLLMALPVAALGGSSAKAGPLDEVMTDFQYGDWAGAFDALVPLADAGERGASRLCLMMHEQGTRLFGGSFPATPAQCSRWLAESNPPCRAV